MALALTADSMGVLLHCLARQTSLEGGIASMATKVKENLQITTNIELNDQRQRVLDYFMVTDPQQILAQARSLRHPQTGLWLLDGEDFQQWLAVLNSRLWLSGIPGAGKTIMAGAMISEVLELCSSTTGLAFFFCSYKDGLAQQSINILQTMTAQLARQSQKAYTMLEAYHKEIQPINGIHSGPTVSRLKEVIYQMVSCFEKVYIIIDGVDECADNVRDVSTTLASIVDEPDSTVSLAILSRDEQVIREVIEDSFVSIEIEAQRDDVRVYVEAEIEIRVQSKQLRPRNMALKDDILHALVDGNGGMFRWVSCQLDYLCELPRDKERREALKSLPPTLNETYQRILEHIELKNESVRLLVQRCLQGIAVAQPALTIWELQEAISIDEDTAALDSESLIDETTILQHCSSLVRMRGSHDADDCYIEFSHFSVAEYLHGPYLSGSDLEKYQISSSNASKTLAIACLRMLCLDEMLYQPTATYEDVEHISERDGKHPFYRYAALLWPTYARNHWLSNDILSLVDRLFNPAKTGIFLSWTLEMGHLLLMPGYHSLRQAIHASLELKRRTSFNNFSSLFLHKGFTPLHMAAALGLDQVCHMLVSKGADVNGVCPSGTPLHFAVAGRDLLFLGEAEFVLPELSGLDNTNHQSVAEDIGNSSISASQDPRLHHHFQYFNHSRPQIIENLIERGARPLEFVRFSLFSCATALCLNIRDFDILKRLVEAGIKPNMTEIGQFQYGLLQFCNLPSSIRVSEARIRFMSFLEYLEHASAASDAAAQLYSVAINITSSKASSGSVDMNKSAPKALDQEIGDPFEAATLAVQYNDDEKLERILKSQNIELNKRVNLDGQTLLHVAAEHVSTESMGVLLRYGCSQSIKDYNGILPIWSCYRDTSSSILRLLIDQEDSQQITTRNIDGDSIWHLASAAGSCQILRLLIEKTRNIQKDLETRNFHGMAPLDVALINSQASAAALLVLQHRGLVTSWRRERPLLHLAAGVGSSDLFKALIDSGVDTQELAEDRSTPLHHLDARSTVRFVQLLKSVCPDLSAKDKFGRRPFESFVRKFHENHWVADFFQLLPVFDELIPSDALDTAPDGLTCWEQFCSSLNTKGRKMLSCKSDGCLRIAVSRLMQLGVVTAHEKARKTSSVLVFIRELAITHPGYRREPGLLRHCLEKLFHHTQYRDDAVCSLASVTLLHNLVKANDVSLVSYLLRMGVSVWQRIEGHSALEAALVSGTKVSTNMLQVLLDAVDSTSLNAVNLEAGGLGLVHLMGSKSLTHGYLQDDSEDDKLQVLIAAGADPDLCTASGIPAVIYHLENRSFSTARSLLDLGADPTLPDNDGCDAMVHAIIQGDVDFLIDVRMSEDERSLPKAVQWDRKVDLNLLIAAERLPLQLRPMLKPLLSDGRVKGCNALHLSALGGHEDVLAFFLNNHLIPDINEATEGGWTAMQFAVHYDHDAIIQFLHSRGADLDVRAMAQGKPAIIRSAGSEELAQTKKQDSYVTNVEDSGEDDEIANHMDDYDRSSDGLLPLSASGDVPHSSLARPRLGRVTLSRHSTAPRRIFTEPVEMFQEAIRQGNLQDCQRLVTNACSVNGKMKCPECTPLSYAVFQQQPRVVEWLLLNGALTDIATCPRHWDRPPAGPQRLPWLAATYPRLNDVLPILLLRYLSEGGNIFTDFAETPLHLALRCGNSSLAVVLVDHIKNHQANYRELSRGLGTGKAMSADEILSSMLNQRDATGHTPLYRVSSYDPVATESLVKNGARVDGDWLGDSPLHRATWANRQDIVDLLLDNGASIDIRIETGETPLMTAVNSGHCLLARHLLDLGADPHATRPSGSTVLTDCARLLLSQGHSAAWELFFHLLSLGLDLNKTNSYGKAPMHIMFPMRHARGLFLSHVLPLDSTPPINWREVATLEMCWLLSGKQFRLLLRALGKRTMQRILNIHPSNDLSALCADIELEGCESGTALMAACEYGRLHAVKFLVRCGASLASSSPTRGYRSAFEAAKASIILLIRLFTTMKSLAASTKEDPVFRFNCKVRCEHGGLFLKLNEGGVVASSLVTDPNQIWKIYSIPGKETRVLIRNTASDVHMISDGHGSNIRCHAGNVWDDNAQWFLEGGDVQSLHNETVVRFRNVHYSDCYLDLEGWNTNPGTPFISWSGNGGGNQTFKLWRR
ncbi:hypothetical protein FZEAL_3472 [Fusarium zealandicum]|uniref:Nephrocystin 3-like N-terminal domain-containing protein n=1 Tax=Fusarium zealandicum TaxID=1053134 RepID=A0A8H4UNP5_9HYPO|nr:hypothetical protein FZEAL_3472 [Fusarium zealandicum]